MEISPESEQKTLTLLRMLEKEIKPTYGEMADALGVKRAAVQDRIARLKKEGLVNHVPGKHRSFTLTELGKMRLQTTWKKFDGGGNG